MIGRFFHTPRARQFNINPRFYDPDKEEREDRERRIKEELGIFEERKMSGKNFRPNIKGQFRTMQGGFSKTTSEARKSSNTRLIVLILILSLVFYLFFYSDFLF